MSAEPEIVDEDSYEDAPEGCVRFVASTHTTGTTTPSGAVFSLSPGLTLKMTQSDAEALVEQGFGTIEGG